MLRNFNEIRSVYKKTTLMPPKIAQQIIFFENKGNEFIKFNNNYKKLKYFHPVFLIRHLVSSIVYPKGCKTLKLSPASSGNGRNLTQPCSFPPRVALSKLDIFYSSPVAYKGQQDPADKRYNQGPSQSGPETPDFQAGNNP